MFQNLFQLTCFLVLGVLLSGCSSKTAAPEKPDPEDPTAATLAAGLRNKRIHFEIKQGDSRETAWFQVGDDTLVAWGKENHYSLTTFGQKELSLFVVDGAKCIEVRFSEARVQVGASITLLEHNLGGRDLDALLKSPDDANAKNVRTATIVKIEEDKLMAANQPAPQAHDPSSRPHHSLAKDS